MKLSDYLINIRNTFSKSGNVRGLLENYFALIFLQAINNILPFITIPYLVKVVGMENYGLTVFAQTLVLYFQLFVDYGFDYTGTQVIAVNRDDPKKLAHVLTCILSLKFILSIGAFIVFSAMIWIIPTFREFGLIYLLSYGILLGNVLFPSWFFQGMERMKYITIINVIIKLLATAAIFLLIKVKSDYLYIPAIYAVGYIVAALIGIIFAFVKFGLRPVRVNLADFKRQLAEGYHIFISTLGISVYRMANPIILGLLFNNSVVGYYSIAEKVIKALQSVTNPLSQALFPFLSKKMSTINLREKINVIHKVALYYLGPLAVSTLLVFLFSDEITFILLKARNTPSGLNLKIMSVVILFGCLNFLYGIIGLINLGEKRFFSFAVLIAGLFSIVVTIAGSKFGGEYWAPISMSLTEILLFLIIYSKINSLKLRAGS